MASSFTLALGRWLARFLHGRFSGFTEAWWATLAELLQPGLCSQLFLSSPRPFRRRRSF